MQWMPPPRWHLLSSNYLLTIALHRLHLPCARGSPAWWTFLIGLYDPIIVPQTPYLDGVARASLRIVAHTTSGKRFTRHLSGSGSIREATFDASDRPAHLRWHVLRLREQ